jgi:integrase
VHAVDRETCEGFKRKREKAKVARSTINRELTTLKSILKYASENGQAPEGLGRHARLYAGVESKQKRVITREELQKLLEACQTVEMEVRAPYLKTLVLLLAYSGLRPSEALRLRWTDLDFGKGAISVKKSKTKAGRRTVPMHPLVQESLKNLQMGTDSEWVFPSPRKAGSHIKDFGKAFEKAVRMAGIPAISPYCLRHTFFTWVDKVEPRRSIVMALGGHTRERYADGYIHPEWGEHQKAINQLPVPTNFTTVPASDQSSAGLKQDETPGLQLFRMVGPCGLEPQTSAGFIPFCQLSFLISGELPVPTGKPWRSVPGLAGNTRAQSYDLLCRGASPKHGVHARRDRGTLRLLDASLSAYFFPPERPT